MIKCSFIGISNIYEFKLEQLDESFSLDKEDIEKLLSSSSVKEIIFKK